MKGDAVLRSATCLLGMLLFVSFAGLCQAPEKSCDTGRTNKSASAPLKTLKGTVKINGDKMTFINDGDQKAWEVMNPETLKGHEGNHVQVSAHIYADKDSMHVMNVKMIANVPKHPPSKPGGVPEGRQPPSTPGGPDIGPNPPSGPPK